MNLFDVIGAGLNLGGGYLAAQASKKAAKTQADAYERAAAVDAEHFRPYAQLGDYAAGTLQRELSPNALLGDFSMSDMEQDPGYQYRLSEGEKSIDRNAGARGKRYSGQTLKALQRFAQDYASNEVDRAYQRDNIDKTRRYNFLAGPVALGQGAGGNQGAYMTSAADARAAGQVGASNALLGGVSDAFSGLNQARYLKQLQSQPVYYIR